MYKQLVRYYWRMYRENGSDWAMPFTLEMFEGMSEAHIEHLIATHDMDGNELVTR